jgi:hypothetical protein
VCQPRRGNPCEKRDDIGLTVAAGLFQNTADVRSDCVRRSAASGGDALHGFTGGEAPGDAGLGRREIEQRLELRPKVGDGVEG